MHTGPDSAQERSHDRGFNRRRMKVPWQVSAVPVPASNKLICKLNDMAIRKPFMGHCGNSHPERMRGKLWAAAVAVLLLFNGFPLSNVHAAQQSEIGLYVYMRHPSLAKWEDIYNAALAADYVDGASISIEWNLVEPKPGVYDWSHLDKWIEKAVSLNKKIALGVVAGIFTPDWLYDPPFGVPRNVFNFNRNPRGIACSVVSQPSVWHPVYLREYGNLIAALSLHLHEMDIPGKAPGAVYNALRIVKLSGINVSTGELRLPANKPDKGPCNQSDATTIWVKAGFTPNKLLFAWRSIAEITNRAFPDKILSVDIIHHGAFPPIDNDGNIYSPTPGKLDEITIKILDTAVLRFQNRLMVKWNALSQAEPPRAIIAAQHEGAQTGWQMNSFLGEQGGSGCSLKPVVEACRSVEEFRSILDNGIENGGNYIEIQAPNVSSLYSSAFREAHERLHENSPR